MLAFERSQHVNKKINVLLCLFQLFSPLFFALLHQVYQCQEKDRPADDRPVQPRRQVPRKTQFSELNCIKYSFIQEICTVLIIGLCKHATDGLDDFCCCIAVFLFISVSCTTSIMLLKEFKTARFNVQQF